MMVKELFVISELPNGDHVTIVPAFTIQPDRIETLFNDIKEIISNFKESLMVDAVGSSTFPSKIENTVKVLNLKKTSELEQLHRVLCEKVIENGGVFDNLDYCFNGFQPHISQPSSSIDYVELKSVILCECELGSGTFKEIYRSPTLYFNS